MGKGRDQQARIVWETFELLQTQFHYVWHFSDGRLARLLPCWAGLNCVGRFGHAWETNNSPCYQVGRDLDVKICIARAFLGTYLLSEQRIRTLAGGTCAHLAMAGDHAHFAFGAKYLQPVT